MVLNIMNISITVQKSTRNNSIKPLKQNKSAMMEQQIEDLKYKYVYPYLMNRM